MQKWKQWIHSKADSWLMPCLFFPCISTINILHTFSSACEDRHSLPCVFPCSSQNQLGKLMNSNTAGTVQEECSSPPSAPEAPMLGEEAQM